MFLLACERGCAVFGVPGGSLEKECEKEGVAFCSFGFWSLLSKSSAFDVFLTARSRDTAVALLVALISGKRVVRLDFVNRGIFWDRFVEVVPVSRLGWVRPYGGEIKKGRCWKVVVVSRLKKERKVAECLRELVGVPFKFRLYVVGGGDESIVKDLGIGIVHIKRKIKRYRRLLASMDIMLYPSAGTDKSCRAVLEAMDSQVVVISKEPLTERYIDEHVGFLTSDVGSALKRLLAHPCLCRKKGLNAAKRVKRWMVPLPK